MTQNNEIKMRTDPMRSEEWSQLKNKARVATGLLSEQLSKSEKTYIVDWKRKETSSDQIFLKIMEKNGLPVVAEWWH